MNILRALLWFVLAYYVLLQGIYLILLILGSIQLRRYRREISFDEFRRIGDSHLTMPVSVIVPCYNEAAIVCAVIRNLLRLNYPQFEIIVVDDGSTDPTMEVLTEAFQLRGIDRFGRKVIGTKDILGVYESPDHPELIVVEKQNGRRADAINAAVTLARYPLICVIDADCVLEEDALLHVARPFLRDTSVGAVAGVVRPSNGVSVAEGRILSTRFPETLLGMNQEMEYARSFQWARTGLARLRSMLCISGALILIRKDLFEELGGPWADAITDDIEFAMRLNGLLHDRRHPRSQKLVFNPDAVCYTEVPETFGLYASQRNRWQRGTLQAIWRNRGMLFNPRYGMTGLFGMPFYLIFEGLAAVVELAAWILMAVCLILGVAGWFEILSMIYLACIAGIVLSLSAVLLTESTRLRSADWGDLHRLLLAVFLDNLGFHQFHLLCRVTGTVQYLFGRRDLGSSMTRRIPSPQETTQAPPHP